MADKPDHNKIELLDAQDYAEYLIDNRLEIAAVLLGLVQQRSIISAYPRNAKSFMLTTLLAVNAEAGTLVFDRSPDEAGNQRALAAERVAFSALLDKIKVQFESGPLSAIQHDGYAAFSAPFPERMLRLQRREYFRLITPVSQSVTCQIPVPLDQGGVKTYEARVLDISGGGLGVLVPPRGLSVSTNMEFGDCSLVLPEFGPITAQLQIRNVFQVTNRNGVTMTRAGCQFVQLPRGAEQTIQRYILKIERERGARGRPL